MFRLKKDILCTERSAPVPAGKPLVLVHPFYECYLYSGFYHGIKDLSLLAKGDCPITPDYYAELQKVIPSHQGPIVVFEEDVKARVTAGHFTRLGRSIDVFFVKTGLATPVPLSGSWDDADKLLCGFNNDLLFGGGYYGVYHTVGCLEYTVHAAGCLTYTIDVLEKRGFNCEIKDKIVFTEVSPLLWFPNILV
jgi:hypothetical protein